MLREPGVRAFGGFSQHLATLSPGSAAHSLRPHRFRVCSPPGRVGIEAPLPVRLGQATPHTATFHRSSDVPPEPSVIQQLEIQPLDRLSFGYCTNVHAGATLATAQENLARYATAVQKKITPNAALPIGLWISSTTTESLRGAEQIAAFKEWLATHRLLPYTFNGFPQGDFHQPVVKHDVYRPTWRDQERLDYTCTLADILSGLLEPNTTGSISTLPLGWPHEHWDDSHLQAAGRHLLDCARRL